MARNTLHNLRDEMNRLFSDLAGPYEPFGWAPFARRAGFPAVNVWETEDELFAEAEIPGVAQDDLEVTVVGGELTIKGSRKPVDDNEAMYHRQERGVGEFTRVVHLPVDVEVNKVEATLSGGVLTVKIPKAEAAKPHKIEVKVG